MLMPTTATRPQVKVNDPSPIAPETGCFSSRLRDRRMSLSNPHGPSTGEPGYVLPAALPPPLDVLELTVLLLEAVVVATELLNAIQYGK